VALSGCEYPEEQPAAAAPAPTAAPEAGYSGGGGPYGTGSDRNSSLAGAKRGAEGIINSAEQASQNVANEADKLNNPGIQ
jgi:hypothetical protein